MDFLRKLNAWLPTKLVVLVAAISAVFEPNSSFGANPEPRLRLLLSTGHGPAQFGGVKGLHGFVYMARDWKTPGLAQTNLVDIYSSENGTRIVVMVLDNGPIYSSTNSGMSWVVVSTPGRYEFPLTIGAGGGGFLAAATIYPSPGIQTNTNPPNGNWHAVGTAPDGSKLVINRDLSSPAPVLSIAQSGGAVVVSWSGAFADFVLQESSSLTTTNWLDVRNAVTQMGERNQVIVSPAMGNNFYRLRPR